MSKLFAKPPGRQLLYVAAVCRRAGVRDCGVLQRPLEPSVAQYPVRELSVRDKAQAEWGRLILEQSTWTAHSRIEVLATEQLKMHIPGAAEVRMVAP